MIEYFRLKIEDLMSAFDGPSLKQISSVFQEQFSTLNVEFIRAD